MNEDNVIGFEVRARILPQIEGTDQFEQNLRNIPNQLQQTVGDVMSSPGFQQNLTQEQIKESQDWLKYSAGLFKPFQEQTEDILQDMDIDMSGGKITKSHVAKYMRRLRKMEVNLGEQDQDVLSDFKDFMGPNATPEVKEKFMLAWKEGKQEALESLEQVRSKVKEVTDEFNKSNNEADNFYNSLKKTGALAVGGMVVNKAMEWLTVGAQVAAKEETSFDLTSPLGSYGERRQYEVFKDTREREVLYSTIGSAIGGVIGALIPGAGFLGAMAGGYFGNQIGTSIAGLQNIGEQADLEKELKIANTSYGTLSGYVNQSNTYDIQRARLRARGTGDPTLPGLGYMPEQEQQFALQFQETLGRSNQELYKEQSAFGRAEGLDPTALYKLNLSARVTGQDVGIGGLDTARGMAKEIYGPDAAPSRTIDILTELKTIAEAQLKLNINADGRDVMRMALVPEMIFGKDNPYGRLGDLGGQTIKSLENLMNNGNPAWDALTFNAFGTNDIWEYTERSKGGVYSGNNLPDILDYIKKNAGGSKDAMYGLLESVPGLPQGSVPKIAEFLNDDKKYSEWEEHYKNPTYGPLTEDQSKRYKEYEDILGTAKKNVSETEDMNKKIRDIQNETADKWRETILNASKSMAEFWGDMGSSEKLHLRLVEDVQKGLDYLREWMGQNHLLPPDPQSVYDDKKPTDIPLIDQGQQNRSSYLINKLGINPNDIGPGSPPARTGKILDDINSYSKWFGNRYEFSLIPGDKGGFVANRKGHTDNSMHYQGSKDDPAAIDFRVYDKKYGYTYTKEDMPKGSALELFIEEIAKALNLRSGTSWTGKDYDPNHLDKGKVDVHLHVSGNDIHMVSKLQNSNIVMHATNN